MGDNKFSIGYYKTNSIDLSSLEQNYIQSHSDIENNYNPFQLDKLQKYNPVYDTLFTLSCKNYNTIQLNHSKHFSILIWLSICRISNIIKMYSLNILRY